MVLMSTAQFIGFLPDIILILISGLACLYCVLLSRRLKKLHNLEDGVGASILTLTRAIEDTHKAAIEAQTSTQDAVNELRDLLDRAEKALPECETRTEDLEKVIRRAQDRNAEIEYAVEVSLEVAINKAQSTAAHLLDAVSEVHAGYGNVLPIRGQTPATDDESDDLDPPTSSRAVS